MFITDKTNIYRFQENSRSHKIHQETYNQANKPSQHNLNNCGNNRENI
jgi:hypothetical protein